MKHFILGFIALAAMAIDSRPLDAAEPDLLDVGSQRQLFIDRAFFEQAKTSASDCIRPKKTGEKILQPDKPWESATLNWFNVMQDTGVVDKEARYRMWYECYDVPGWPTDDDTSFCYAESRDGIHWTKPQLGLFEYQGNKNNNILFRQIGPAGGRSRVARQRNLRDPTARPSPLQGRFARHLVGKTPPTGLRAWTRPTESIGPVIAGPICDMFADSQDSGFWDSSLEQVRDLRPDWRRGRTIESHGLLAIQSARTGASGRRQRSGQLSNLYNSAVMKYAGAANVYLMFPSLYQHDPDTLDIRLAVSRDGIHWSYPDQKTAYIPLGKAGAWDSGSLYIGQGYRNDDETWLYYSGSPLRHNKAELENLIRCKQPCAFSRVVILAIGFVSVRAGQEGRMVRHEAAAIHRKRAQTECGRALRRPSGRGALARRNGKTLAGPRSRRLSAHHRRPS